VKCDLSKDKDVSCGATVTETGTCILLYSLESARQVLKDVVIDEGKIMEGKLLVVFGCSCLLEESPKVKISVAGKIHFQNLFSLYSSKVEEKHLPLQALMGGVVTLQAADIAIASV